MMRNRSALVVTMTLVVLVVGCSAERDTSGAIESSGALDAFAMQVGDCFDDTYLNGDAISDVPGVPCDSPHDNQVFALFDIPGTKFPGDDAVEELAEQGCYERFESAIGLNYEESVIDYTTIYPSEGSWTERGDQEVICVAFHMELEKLEGTVLGSGR